MAARTQAARARGVRRSLQGLARNLRAWEEVGRRTQRERGETRIQQVVAHSLRAVARTLRVVARTLRVAGQGETRIQQAAAHSLRVVARTLREHAQTEESGEVVVRKVVDSTVVVETCNSIIYFFLLVLL